MDSDTRNGISDVLPSDRTRRAALTVVVVLAVATASTAVLRVSAPRPDADAAQPATTTAAHATTTGPDTAASGAPPDPPHDVLGWENGVWYNESIAVDQSDGLNASERRAYVARSMARVEYLRRLEFTENVTVETVPRSRLPAVAANTTFGNDTSFGASTSDQLWEATFLINESTNATQAIRQYDTAVVLGYAAEEGADHVVIVTNGSENPAIGSVTLIHELVHMLQDQHFDLSDEKYRRHTLDGEFGKDGLVEGGATYVQKRYQRKCRGAWSCVGAPPGWSGTGRVTNRGLSRLFYQPYSDGPVYVDRLHRRGGWNAVNEAWRSPPVASEQIIHPDRPREEPAPISFENTAENGWTVLDQRGQPSQRVGEVGIFTLFWNQARSHDVPALERQLGEGTDGPFDTFNYTSVPSAGWGNDRLVAYRKGGKRGYVWKTKWDSRTDARQFATAYRRVLRANDAVERGNRTWVIPSGGFADAFRVVRHGSTVTIVNGPTVRALNDIRPETASQD